MDFLGAGMAVGRCGLIRVHELEISVIVRDVRIRSFVVDLLVEPIAGSGKLWVESNTVRISESENDGPPL